MPTKHRLNFLIFILIFITTYLSGKYVIGTSSWGLFACFFNTLNHIKKASDLKEPFTVYWGKSCPYYDPNGFEGTSNAWEYYFEPVSNITYTPGDTIHEEYLADLPLRPVLDLFANIRRSDAFETRRQLKNFIDKYVKIKPRIQKKVQDFFLKNIYGKPTIGIHLRGTDKKTEITQIDPSIIITQANRFKGYQYFIATDEERLLQFAKNSLRGPVIYYDSFRSKDGKPVHFYNNNKCKAGEDMLIEALILASCSIFIHTFSNVSMAVLCFNPRLKNILISSNHMII